MKDHRVFVCNSTISLSSQDNHLKVLPDNIFVDLHNLSHLFLHGNRLWSLNQNTFRGPRALDRLLLHQNQIEWVDHSAFQDLKHLSTLYLFNNSLLQLSRQCLDMLPSLEYLRLNNNPWVCDCRALSLWLWLKQFRGSTSTVGCQSPPEMIGKDLKDLRREDFPNCSLTVSNSRGQTNNVSGTVNQSTTNLVHRLKPGRSRNCTKPRKKVRDENEVVIEKEESASDFTDGGKHDHTSSNSTRRKCVPWTTVRPPSGVQQASNEGTSTLSLPLHGCTVLVALISTQLDLSLL